MEENLIAITQETAEALRSWAQKVTEELEQFCEQLRELWGKCLPIITEAIESTTVAGRSQNKRLPRPPRYAGPQNKGRSWSSQPPRLARSSCRKYRR